MSRIIIIRCCVCVRKTGMSVKQYNFGENIGRSAKHASANLFVLFVYENPHETFSKLVIIDLIVSDPAWIIIHRPVLFWDTCIVKFIPSEINIISAVRISRRYLIAYDLYSHNIIIIKWYNNMSAKESWVCALRI